mmetsp:Transcript_28144/g.66619  ORF Transcript_28144/g.66619 Transcript_28144/m.66619 type:complete len:206 (-) Transcript_28144:489-1106(-)
MPAAHCLVILSVRGHVDDPQHGRLAAILGLQCEALGLHAHERGRQQPWHAVHRALVAHALEERHVLGRQRPAAEGHAAGWEGHRLGVAHSAGDEERVDGAEDRAGVLHQLAVVAADCKVEHRAELHPLKLLPGRPEPLRRRRHLPQHLILALERFLLQLGVEPIAFRFWDAALLAVAEDEVENRTKQLGLPFRALCAFVYGLEPA